MKQELLKKYRPYPPIDLPDRQWPSRTLNKAPVWCSVDLRDGNQALISPMNVEQKGQMFQLLVDLGFKEIEVGFPSASQADFDFLRKLIEEDLVPEDVTIQVLTPAREPLIHRTFEAIRGAGRAVVHLYNPTSTLQRRVVFGMSRPEIKNLAVQGATWIREEAERIPATKVLYEYTPESFTGTELDFALEVSEAVMDVWEASSERRVIVNLPATVEMSTPNVYADQIEWFARSLDNRNRAVISVHAHNDRGTGVAATELAMLAGAERVEGTLFGNGERTGNVDLLTLALNLYSQGIDPGLDLHDAERIAEVWERCTQMTVHPRHPYFGEMVYTAFSGSHQDAINKGMKAREASADGLWEVPYLPIDPADLGRTYESVIRINSQSGKGGVAYIMEREFGYRLPKTMHPEFSAIVQAISDKTAGALTPHALLEAFEETYFRPRVPFELTSFTVLDRAGDRTARVSHARIAAEVSVDGNPILIRGEGNGPVDAFCSALKAATGIAFDVLAYHEHALEKGSSATAASYVQIEDARGDTFWGAHTDTDVIIASVRAVLSALNRSNRG